MEGVVGGTNLDRAPLYWAESLGEGLELGDSEEHGRWHLLPLTARAYCWQWSSQRLAALESFLGQLQGSGVGVAHLQI